MKRCCTCSESKSIDEFWRNATAPDGRDARCKQCRKAHCQRQPGPRDRVTEDLVACRLCGVRLRRLGGHLQAFHQLSTVEYRRQFPGEPTAAAGLRGYYSELWHDTRGQVDVRDGGIRRLTRCKRGHSLTGDNVEIVGGRRRCVACARAATRRSYQRAKAQAPLCRCGCGERVNPRAGTDVTHGSGYKFGHDPAFRAKIAARPRRDGKFERAS